MISESVVATLEPYVGRTAADTCVRATALSAGKTAGELGVSDVPMLCESVERLLGPIIPSAALDRLVADIRGLA